MFNDKPYRYNNKPDQNRNNALMNFTRLIEDGTNSSRESYKNEKLLKMNNIIK